MMSHTCRDKIGLTVLELLEKGELQKLHKKWWFDKGECVVDDSKVGLLRISLPIAAISRFFADWYQRDVYMMQYADLKLNLG